MIGELAIKLAAPMSRPMKVELIGDGAVRLKAIARPIDPPLRLNAVTFSPSLDTVYAYAEGNSTEPLQFSGIELDGRPFEGNLWLSSRTLGKREKQIAVLRLANPLARGAYLTVAWRCENGALTVERVRVFSAFPLSVDRGNPPSGFGLDEAPFVSEPRFADAGTRTSQSPAPVPAPAPQGGQEAGDKAACNRIFQCAMHAYGGDKNRSAREILRRYDVSVSTEPSRPCSQHLCRVGAEMGYALFSELTDMVEFNPNIRGLALDRSLPAEQCVARIAGYATRSAQPRPVIAVDDLAKLDDAKSAVTPDEFRRRVFTGVGLGAKGVLLRLADVPKLDGDGPLRAEVVRCMGQLRSVRDSLAIAEPVPWAVAERPETADVYALLAGNRTLILVVVRRSDGKALTAGRDDGVSVALCLPEWFAPVSLARVGPQGRVPETLPDIHSGELRFRLDVPGVAEMYELDAREENAR